MPLHRVLYCSRRRSHGSAAELEAELAAILSVSRVNNSRDGISGGLLFSQGWFAQVLEGPLDAVEAAFERIQCDERHGEVTVIQTGAIDRRDFPEWSMAFTGVVDTSHPSSLDLSGSFLGRSADGDAVLRLMRNLVRSEQEWPAVAS